ncbi:MAG TPA: putative quinol monooxygenase [Chthonomonadales bacterium]|nr:putative quinol monooxygenase [Chthonomonadales bacterium]
MNCRFANPDGTGGDEYLLHSPLARPAVPPRMGRAEMSIFCITTFKVTPESGGRAGLSFTIFAEFSPLPGNEEDLAEAIRTVVPLTRAESGCISICAYQSIRAPVVYYIFSEWPDEAAFELHATLQHTMRFVESASGMISHPFKASRTRPMS